MVGLPTVELGSAVKVGISPNEDDVVSDSLGVLFSELRSRKESLRKEISYLNAHPISDTGGVMSQMDKHSPALLVLRNMAQTNFAKLIVTATTDRLGILGFKTSADPGEGGDEELAKAFTMDSMAREGLEAMRLAVSHGFAYLYVDPFTGRQKVIPPTNGCVVLDAVGEVQAALVLRREKAARRDVLDFHYRAVDDITGEATGPVRVFRAVRDVDVFEDVGSSFAKLWELKVTRRDHEIPLSDSVEDGWEWLTFKTFNYQRVHVTPLVNESSTSDFMVAETIMNRITHMRWTRLIIATLQGLRQRAVVGDLPRIDPETGEEIDYNKVFSAEPNSVWIVPDGSSMWESAPASFADNTAAVNDDKKELAALTKTPMSYLSDATNQSAEGAGMLDDLYLSKILDRRQRFGSSWQVHMANVFEAKGDSDRSDSYGIEVVWEPIKSWSITESAAALASFTAAKLPLETALRVAMGMTPREISEVLAAAAREKLSPSSNPAAALPLNRSQALNANQQQQAKDNQPSVGRVPND